MALITKENAKEYGRRSGEAKRLRKLTPPIQPVLCDPMTVRKVARLRRQIAMIDDRIEQGPDAETLDLLTKCSERLFKQWVHLAGIPSPGQYKPSNKGPRVNLIQLPEPEAMPVAPVLQKSAESTEVIEPKQ